MEKILASIFVTIMTLQSVNANISTFCDVTVDKGLINKEKPIAMYDNKKCKSLVTKQIFCSAR